MQIAIGLARRGHGNVAPNPSVGCVIVKKGFVVGRGWTQPGGRPHAETEALRRAKEQSIGATAFITLEPCSHYGETEPCAQALIDAGISHVVIGIRDPDPRVDGRGIKLMKEAGVVVTEGICQRETEDLVSGFSVRINSGCPLVTAKVASTLDGKIATSRGDSRWITGPLSRAIGHGLRARHDAILIGGYTALVDNPSLTCRLPGLENQSPIRIVMDGKEELPGTHTLLNTAKQFPTWIMVPRGIRENRKRRYREHGVEVMEIGVSSDEKMNLKLALSAIGGRGITSLLVEGGGQMISGFLRERLVNQLVWFRAPKIIGADGVSVLATLGVDALDDALNLIKLSTRYVGDDIVETYALSI